MARRKTGGKKGGLSLVNIIAVVFLIYIVKNIFFDSDSPPSGSPPASGQPETQVHHPKPEPSQLFALSPANNNWPPSIEGMPVAAELLAQNYYVVLDGSGSMDGSECVSSGNKLTAAKSAINRFMEQVDESANVGLLVFDAEGVKERLALGRHQPGAVRQAIAGVRAGGGTPLSTAVENAYRALNQQAARQLGYGEYHMVVVTDGEANAGFDPTRAVNRVLGQSPVLIHTIGFCIKGNHSLNQQGLTLYKAADDPQSLGRGLADVLAEAPDFTVLQFEGD